MERKAVKSSNIAEVGYDAVNQILEVKYKNGGIYQYSGVDEKSHAELMESESIGGCLHKNIRPGCECRRIMEEEKVDE